ncbi:MAG: DUF1223 domain-containing protein [Verrucomicrobia bacterium]|nr:DUF1223 domain-containing protein [Verrucomicrobiota bacterium]
MKQILLTTLAVVLLAGCGGEPPPAESLPGQAEAKREAAPAPVATAEPRLAKPVEEPPPPRPSGPVPTVSIHEAAAQGNIEIVRQHLAVQPEGYVNTRTPSDWTPLHFAYAQGRREMSRFLLDNGAEYEAKNKLGQAPADIPLLKRNLKNSQFALVELYTSESCSSCPPAERLTAEIRRMAQAKRLNIFCVSFHVDYFDGGSWTDGFSDARFSARQRAYEHKRFSGYYYTPQMIVNGKYQTLGHNRANAFNAINRSLKLPATATVSVRQVKKEDGALAVNACTLGRFENAALCVALVENGVRRPITGGENKGRTLGMDNVVLEFQCIDLVGPLGHEFTFALKPSPGAAKRNLGAVAFVQRTDNLDVLGAQAAPLRWQPGDESTKEPSHKFE